MRWLLRRLLRRPGVVLGRGRAGREGDGFVWGLEDEGNMWKGGKGGKGRGREGNVHVDRDLD